MVLTDSRTLDSEDLVEIAPEIWRLRVPIPVPLRFVNCYLLRGPRDSWALVDTAMHDDIAIQAWRTAFERLGIAPRRVGAILVTHYHPDHYGAAGALQLMTGAEVLMLDREAEGLDSMYAPATGGLTRYLELSGVPADLLAEVSSYQELIRTARVVPHPSVTTFPVGSCLSLGQYEFEVIFAPGHTDGSAVFVDKTASLMLAGDVVLSGITPNISYFAGFGDDPLGRYLRTLAGLRDMPGPRLILAGHRQPIEDLPSRCEEIRVHHHRRLDLTAGLAERAVDGWTVACGLFGDVAQMNPMFAVGEALSHLEYLVVAGAITKEQLGDRIYYGRDWSGVRG